MADGQVWGSLSRAWLRRLAIDVSIVNPTAVSHSGAGACGESFLNPNAGTRAAEETKTNKYKLLCEQRGMDFVPGRLSSQRVEGWESSSSGDTQAGIHTGLEWQRRIIES